jgi:hypothetical protein
MYSKIWYFLCVLVLCTQVNTMFVVLLSASASTPGIEPYYPKGRGFDSHRGQANFSARPVWMHTQSNITDIHNDISKLN